MTENRRLPLIAGLVAAAAVLAAFFLARGFRPGVGPKASEAAAPLAPPALVATMRAEPPSFNRYVSGAFPTHLISLLTQARLVRINRLTQAVEPWLAERWDVDAPGTTYTLHLRPGLAWSDGRPFTSADVTFSFEAIYAATTASPIGDALKVGGRPLAVDAPDPSTVRLTFPAFFAPGLRLLDGLPIYPRHKLEPALRAGTLRKAWAPDTPPAELVGMGPFVIDAYRPAERIELRRNPRYWRTDAQGTRLPYLDRLTLEIAPDQGAELLRLESGQADLLQSELRPDDYATVKRAANAGRLRLANVGTGLDTHLLWFNLSNAASTAVPAWLRRAEFRQAVSQAVDRRALAEAVYLGAADPVDGPVWAAHGDWYDPTVPRHAYNPVGAKNLLDTLALSDRDGDGRLEDSAKQPVRFSILVQKGVTAGEKGALFIQQALGRLGVTVDVVPLELGAMMGRWAKGDYQAIYHLMIATDTDPGGNLDWWLSSGSAHLWAPGQARPATAWERQIDQLMLRQVAERDPVERRRLFSQVLTIFQQQSPALYFAAPHVFVATSTRVAGATPAVQRPQLLWSADTLSVAR